MVARTLTALALLGLLAACAPAEEAPPGEGAVTVSDFTFQPDRLSVSADTTVTWTNEDDVAHTATADDGSFDVSLPAGESGTHTFDEPGAYPYLCTLHPQMTAEVAVNG